MVTLEDIIEIVNINYNNPSSIKDIEDFKLQLENGDFLHCLKLIMFIIDNNLDSLPNHDEYINLIKLEYSDFSKLIKEVYSLSQLKTQYKRIENEIDNKLYECESLLEQIIYSESLVKKV